MILYLQGVHDGVDALDHEVEWLVVAEAGYGEKETTDEYGASGKPYRLVICSGVWWSVVECGGV